MSQWFRNGERVESLTIDDRAIQYGDGLFETIAVRNGEARLLDLHMTRLTTGCERLRIDVPDVSALQDDLVFAVQQSHEISAYCVVKIIVSSGVTLRGYGRSPTATPTVLIGVFPTRPVSTAAYRSGVDAMICDTRLATGSPTAGLKTLNRIEQVLGRSECISAGAFEGLMLDADDRLICGTMSNVFMIFEQRIVTPKLIRCGVEGVMRRFAIDCLSAAGDEVHEDDVTFDEFMTADEIFLTNSQFGALPLSNIGGHARETGDMTRHAMGVLARNGIAECAT